VGVCVVVEYWERSGQWRLIHEMQILQVCRLNQIGLGRRDSLYIHVIQTRILQVSRLDQLGLGRGDSLCFRGYLQSGENGSGVEI